MSDNLPVPSGPPQPTPTGADGGGGVPGPASPSSPAPLELANLERMMGRPNSAYWKGPLAAQHQARYRELVEAGGAGLPTPKGDAAAERGEIEAMMGRKNSAYWKGPEAPRLQARYRELIGGEAAGDGEFWASPNVVRERMAKSDPALLADLDDGIFDDRVRNLQASFERLFVPLSLEDGQALEADFEILPKSAQKAVFVELTQPRLTAAPLASAAEIAVFRTMADGDMLAREWGRNAPRNLGIVRRRFERLRDSMSGRDFEAFERWWDHSDPGQRAAMLRAVVA